MRVLGSSDSGYELGSIFWLYDPQKRREVSPKLQISWKGPYEIVNGIKKVSGGESKVVQFNRLAPVAGNNAEAQMKERRKWSSATS